MFSGTKGAMFSAQLYSMVETAKANGNKSYTWRLHAWSACLRRPQLKITNLAATGIAYLEARGVMEPFHVLRWMQATDRDVHAPGGKKFAGVRRGYPWTILTLRCTANYGGIV